METQLAPKFHPPWRMREATPAGTQTDLSGNPSPPDDGQMRRALPILTAWLAFYAIAVIGCLYADRQHAAQRAETATAAATVGAR
jgi:hypothetical protein